MTLVFIILTSRSDPGYLDKKYQHPKTAEGYAPLNQMRALNLKHFSDTDLYDFSYENVFSQDEENFTVSFQTGISEEDGAKELASIKRQISETDVINM